MIAPMPDFARIDRELAAIGSVPEAVQPLLDAYGQRDRSLENVDQVLAALRDGRPQSSNPPEQVIERPSFLPLGWDADRKSDPGEPMAAIALERDEIAVTTGVPETLNEVAPIAEPDAPESEPEPEPPIDTQQSSPPPPANDPPPMLSASPEPSEPEASEPRHAPRPSRPPRADLQALLDAELDPREFPSTNPPRFTRSSSPPPPLAPVEPAAQEADFELLVDDDDILEIDEDGS